MSVYYRMVSGNDLTINELIDRGTMAMIDPESHQHARYIKHLPVEAIEHLGEVKESSPTPAADPLEGDSPFPLSPYSTLFESDEHPDECRCEDCESRKNDKAWGEFSDNATDAEMAEFVAEMEAR